MKSPDRLNIDRVAFIGRTYSEYARMFALDEALLRKGPVLDCAAGPSSFTAEAQAAGFDVTACDLLYDQRPGLLAEKGGQDIEHVFDKLDEVKHLYAWTHYKNKEEIIGLRHRALHAFSRDFVAGRSEGRYVRAELPRLPFPDRSFTLVLASHFLFLYGDRLDLAFHVASLREMMRVSRGEVRVFPLQGLDARTYSRMDELIAKLDDDGIETEVLAAPFEFQRGSNKLMKLRRSLSHAKISGTE